MKIGAVGGYVSFGPVRGASARTASASAGAAAAKANDDAALRQFGLFLNTFTSRLTTAQRAIDGAGHNWHRRPLTVASTKTLSLSPTGSSATLRSSGAVGGAPNTFSPTEPSWNAATRSQVTLGGTYDGSNGDQTLTLRAVQGGVIGSDALVFDVLDESGNQLEQLNVAADYAVGDDITLANGLTIALGAGTLGAGDTFAVDVASEAGTPVRSFSPGTPAWAGESTTQAAIAGAYDGSNGTQTLTFRVASAGEVGVDALLLDVLDGNGDLLQQVNVASDYVAGSALTLANGLTVSLGAGQAVEGDTFTVDVSETAGVPTNSATPVGTEWSTPTRSAATIGGAYDGTYGTGQLTLRATTGGVTGSNDLAFDLLDAEGNVLQQVSIATGYTPGDEIALGGGLTLALGAGAIGSGDAFTLDVAFDAGGTQSSATPDTTGWNTGFGPTTTIGGTYDGSNGTQDLTLRVAQGSDVGSSEVLIDVLDANGELLEQLTVAADYTGDPIALANGLTLSLSTGQLAEGDAFTLSVATSATVDADAAFDGGGGAPPAWLQDATVSDGSFELNGVTIDVYASDSLNAVLDRINAADAGVTASFNAATSRVVLAQQTPGSEGDIQLAGDTSGFLAAMHLDDATLAPGGSSDFAAALDQVAALADVTGGTITVNGKAVAIDTTQDTLDDITARLAAAGVTLDFDEDEGTFSLKARGQLTVDDGDTGFFAALGIDEGEYANRTEGFGDPGLVSGSLRELSRTWGDYAGASLEGTAAAQAVRLDKSLRTAIERYFEDAGIGSSGDTLRTEFGLGFRFREDGRLEISLDEDLLAREMRVHSQRIQDFLVGRDQEDGLFDILSAALRPTGNAVNSVLKVRGLSALDLYA